MATKKTPPPIDPKSLINKQTRGVDADTSRKMSEAYPHAVAGIHAIQAAFEPTPDGLPPTNAKLLMRQQNELQKFVNYVTPNTRANPASEFYRKDRDPKYMHTYKSKP